ncbi:MAG: CRISPR-associated CARF protein Csa3, partial [Candidatus Altiarchaeota archaeon]|nr:CRISPR-associated CARF protein Csa3 [Candidatus Altiarchaeota archaeon]
THGKTIIINITGARKTQSLGALYGAYARRELIEKIVYITEEDNETIELPLLSFNLSKTKKRILEEIKNGEKSVRNLAKKTGISRAMAYHHIRELKESGYITDQNGMETTTAGELAIL